MLFAVLKYIYYVMSERFVAFGDTILTRIG